VLLAQAVVSLVVLRELVSFCTHFTRVSFELGFENLHQKAEHHLVDQAVPFLKYPGRSYFS
jgi:hypothetical protein